MHCTKQHKNIAVQRLHVIEQRKLISVPDDFDRAQFASYFRGGRRLRVKIINSERRRTHNIIIKSMTGLS